MKKIIYVFLALIILAACHQDGDVAPRKGQIKFTIDNSVTNGRTENDLSPDAIYISIKKANGDFVQGYEHKRLGLLNLGQAYMTEPIDLIEGEFAVTEFLVVDANDNVIYATPLEGSDLASLVIDPLPVYFTVSADNGTVVNLQVTTVDDMNVPEDFGYASFGFEIVSSPDQIIEISYAVSTNPFYLTEGYDSVIVMFTSAEKTIRKDLQIISPVAAKGSITLGELEITGNNFTHWDIKVMGYYHVIDAVEYNYHVNEAIGTLSYIDIMNSSITDIKITNDELKLVSENVDYGTYSLNWENFAHLTDDAGSFHFVVNNDMCDPSFTYTLFHDVYYGYYEKITYDEYNTPDYRSTNTALIKGTYTDTNTFANMCPSQPSEMLLASVYFLIDSSMGGFHDCYLVWGEADVPVDPEKTGRSSTTKASGFKVLTPDQMKSNGRLRKNSK